MAEIPPTDPNVPPGPADPEPREFDRRAARWVEMLDEAKRADDAYHGKVDNIDKLYSDLDSLSATSGDRQFQIFWANLEVLKPSIYSRPPVPVVTPRFRDRKPLPARAAEVLERALVSDFEADDVHSTLIAVRDDLAVGARGVAWLRIGERDGAEVPLAEHIDRKDFRHEPARKWPEVTWVARRAWLTRDEVRERFGEVPLDLTFQQRKLGSDVKNVGSMKAEVWELWHKDEKLVVFIGEGCVDVLDIREPWMDLTGFFPCPRPAYGTLKRATLTPVPDFVYYRDQVEEINEMTARISALADALRMRGFYPAGNPEIGDAIERALKQTDDRALMVPVSSMAALGNVSLKDSIIWLPVREVAEVIVQLIGLRRQLIEDVYEITGLSDIMRGATDANETLGAQQLKSQYGSIRIRERQGEMVRLARDITRMKAELMAENIPLPALLEMGQVDDLPTMQELQQQAQQMMRQAEQQAMQAAGDGSDPAMAQQAEQIFQATQGQAQALMSQVTQEQVAELFQSQRVRPFALDIETDSTIQPDENAEKERRTEFLTAVGGFISNGAPIVTQAPMLAPFFAEALRFAASGFRAGREMDGAIDELAEAMKGMGGGQKPDPLAEAEAESVKRKDERDDALAQAEIQLKGAQAQKLMMPDSEPVKVDPLDERRQALAERKQMADEDRGEAEIALKAIAMDKPREVPKNAP